MCNARTHPDETPHLEIGAGGSTCSSRPPSILVIGGTGSIGREVVRLALERGHTVTCLSRCDTRQAEMYEEIGRPDRLTMLIGDVTRPDSLPAHAGPVIHLAALKHVPACERQPGQAVAINYYGTVNVLRQYSEQVTLVSTDKSVHPTSAYGMTKALAERVTLQAGGRVCRLVNITSSRGSILPLAERQAKRGTVYLTHSDMARYFMRVGDAAELILDVAASKPGGRVYMPAGMTLKRIQPLLEDIAAEHGAEVEIIGPRPGEKLREDLAWPEEEVVLI